MVQKTHAGASKFILSNDAAFYNNLILYMNAIAGAGAANASTTVKGIVQAATVAQINAGTATGSTGAVLAVTPDALINSESLKYVTAVRNTGISYGVATGTASAYTLTLATSLVSTLASGTYVNFLVPITNATGVTLNINSLGAKALRKNGTTALYTGDLTTGQIATAVYDGTVFQVPGTRLFSSGSASKNLGDSNTTQTIAHGLSSIPKKLRFSWSLSSSDRFASGIGTFDPSGQFSSSSAFDASSGNGAVVSSSIAGIILVSGADPTVYLTGTVSVDATNISIAWVRTGTPSGTVTFIWESEA